MIKCHVGPSKEDKWLTFWDSMSSTVLQKTDLFIQLCLPVMQLIIGDVCLLGRVIC